MHIIIHKVEFTRLKKDIFINIVIWELLRVKKWYLFYIFFFSFYFFNLSVIGTEGVFFLEHETKLDSGVLAPYTNQLTSITCIIKLVYIYILLKR